MLGQYRIVRRSFLAAGLALVFAADGSVNAHAQGDESSSITIATFRDVPHLDRTKLDGGLLEHYSLTDSLFRIDANGNLLPGIVDSWEQINLGRTRLMLRQDTN
jgi:ABC-type transport system substrate-binding protein